MLSSFKDLFPLIFLVSKIFVGRQIKTFASLLEDLSSFGLGDVCEVGERLEKLTQTLILDSSIASKRFQLFPTPSHTPPQSPKHSCVPAEGRSRPLRSLATLLLETRALTGTGEAG